MSLPVPPLDGMHDDPFSSSSPCHAVRARQRRETCRPSGLPAPHHLPLATAAVGSNPVVVAALRSPVAAAGMCYTHGPSEDSESHSTADPGPAEVARCDPQLAGNVESQPQARTEEEQAGFCDSGHLGRAARPVQGHGTSSSRSSWRVEWATVRSCSKPARPKTAGWLEGGRLGLEAQPGLIFENARAGESDHSKVYFTAIPSVDRHCCCGSLRK